MLNSLPFLQDPRRFLQSYFWGCNQGHKLSLRCRQQLEQIPADSQDAMADSRTSEKILESVLDCYVHTKVCARCEPIEKVTCQRGYQLIKERDTAFDEAFRMGLTDRILSDTPGDSLTEEQLQAVFNKEFAQKEFLQHMGSCELCALKQPRGRYSMAAWNIEAARSRRLE
jgi:hypothetical protein